MMKTTSWRVRKVKCGGDECKDDEKRERSRS